MNISPIEVRFDDAQMCVYFANGRTLGVPLAWFPRLLAAMPEQRACYPLLCRYASSLTVSQPVPTSA